MVGAKKVKVGSGGCKDKALSFNGVDEYIDIGGLEYPFNTLSDPDSLSIWFKYTSTSSFDDVIRLRGDAANQELRIYVNGGNIYTRFHTTNSIAQILINDRSYNDGEWIHLVQTWDGTTRRAYINGILKGTNNASDSASAGTHFGYIAGNGGQYEGEIDNVQFFDKALSASEVQEIYNNGRPINPLSYSFVDSLVAAYSLGENDTFGSNGVENLVGTNGTANNMDSSNVVCGVESDITECTSNALRFNGSDEYVDIGNSWYPFIGGDSVSFWMKSTSTVANSQTIFAVDNGVSPNGAQIIFNGSGFLGQVGFRRERLNNNNTAFSSTLVNDGNWHHIVGTWDGVNTMRIYVDGVLEDTTVRNGQPYLFGGNFGTIASFNNSSHSDTVLDEMSIFSSALSQTEVDELYNQGIPLDATTHSQSSNLSAYWKFTDSDTFVSNGILDSSGNANHGTAVNMDSTNLVCGVDNDPQIICNSDEVLDLNPVLYLDRACSNFTVASGSAISQWNDISGNGYHATQFSAFARPILTPESVSFDGVADFMIPFTQSDFRFHWTQLFTILIEVEFVDYTDNRQHVFIDSTDSRSDQPGIYFDYRGSNRRVQFRTPNTTGGIYPLLFTTPNNTITQNKNKILVKCDGSPATSKMYINGSEIIGLINGSSGSPNNVNHTTTVNLGRRDRGDKHLDGGIYKLVIWDSAITDQQAIDLTS